MCFPVPKTSVTEDKKTVEKRRLVMPFFNINSLLNVRATPLPTITDKKAELAGSCCLTARDVQVKDSPILT